MASIPEIIKLPELKSVKDLSTPLGKTNEEDGHQFITNKVIQRLLVHPYTGIINSIPEDIQRFFRTPPMDAFLGDTFVHTRMGTTYPWIMPKARIGDQYKHIKPIDVPIFEEGDRYDMDFQCSQAIRTGKFGEKLNNLENWNTITSLYCQQTTSAIYTLITKLFTTFWCAATCPVTNIPLIFDQTWEEMAKKMTAGADGSQDKILKDLQESFHGVCDALIKRAQRIKNRAWYDPGIIANWRNKGDNSIDIVEAKEPANIGTEYKTYAKALYTEGGNTKKTPRVTRDISIYAQLSMLARTITELTGTLPRHTNSVEHDTKEGVKDNTILQACRCNRSSLIIVCSEWDYNDLMAGVELTGSANKTLSLTTVANGITVIPVAGIAPGHMYVGEDTIMNFFIKLKHSGSVFHWREEETQYYSNFWLAFATFTKMVCGKVILPCKNYTASPEFYYRFSLEINKA